MGHYSDIELLLIEKFTEAIGVIIDLRESSQWDKDKLMFAACINEEEKEKTIRKEIKKMQKKLTKCSPDIAGFLRCYINPSENDLKVSSGYGFRFNLIRNFLFQEFIDVLEVLSVKFKNIEDVENIDYLEWQESIEEGHYGIDNKFMLHFISYMVIAHRLVIFKSFIETELNSSKNQPLILNKLFSYFEKLNELEKTKNLELQDHFNRYGDNDNFEIELKFDIEAEPLKESVLIEIDKTYKNAKEHNIYFFDCSFDVYKKHFKKRKDNYFKENIDATELDFLLSEVDYFSIPKENRVFIINNISFNYSSYFVPENKYVLSLKRKLEFLEEKLKNFNREIDYSFLEPNPLGYTGINIVEIQSVENNKSMIPSSTWDYPLENDYKWYELILNSFKTKTDTENPIGYFKTEFLKRDDVIDSNRFYNLIIEYANNLKKAFLDLSKNGNALPNNANNVLKQLYDCKHIWQNPNFHTDNLFNTEETFNIRNELKINEDNFDEIINVINALIKNKKSNKEYDIKENKTPYNFKDLVPDINRQKYILNILEGLSITANGKFNLSSKRKGALRGVVEALRENNIISNLSLEKLNYAIASVIKMSLRSKLDWSKTSDDYKNKALEYIKKNPFR